MPSVGADQNATLIERFRRARRDPTRAVLEGFHAIKHAIRFHAALEQVCAADADELRSLVGRLAPDIGPELSRLVQPVPPAVFAELAPVPPETGVIAVAQAAGRPMRAAILRTTAARRRSCSWRRRPISATWARWCASRPRPAPPRY